jgi:hypothetical protein
LEKQLLTKSWQQARPGVQVKLLPEDGEFYVLAESADRVAKERAMRRRQLKWLWARLKQIATMQLKREELLMKLGAARSHAPKAWRLRIEAHIFIAFLAYCLHATLGFRLKALAPGLTPRSVLDKFAAVQMIDVHIPTTDGRELLLTRYTEPEQELNLLLAKLKLALPEQPPPKITVAGPAHATPV